MNSAQGRAVAAGLGLGLAASLIGAAIWIIGPGGDKNQIRVPISEFVERANSGELAEIVVCGTRIQYRIQDSADIYETVMESGNTIRPFLQGAEADPKDIPSIKILETPCPENLLR